MPANKQENKITEWLKEDQYNKALSSDKKGINATLQIFSGKNGKGMKKEYKDKLEAKLKTL